jgi:hypothetical protein
VTETGVWAFNASKSSSNEGVVGVPISFNIPLASNLSALNIKFEGDSHCTGTSLNPTAGSGFLCIYQFSAENAEITESEFPGLGVGKVGALVQYTVTGDEAFGRGSFAMTAP